MTSRRVLQRRALRIATQRVAHSGVTAAQFSGGSTVNSIIYLVGLIVVVMFILSVLGLR
jgi:hypothetical protein